MVHKITIQLLECEAILGLELIIVQTISHWIPTFTINILFEYIMKIRRFIQSII